MVYQSLSLFLLRLHILFNMSTGPVRKRRRVDITAAQKRDLCVYKAEHPKVTDIISHSLMF